MDIVRKLFFAPFFLFSLVVLLIFANQLLLDPVNVLFGFNAENAFTIIYLVSALLITGFFYIVFVTLATDWKIIIPVILLAALVPFGLFSDLMVGLYLGAGVLVAAMIGFFVQQNKMKSYITFSATHLLSPQIKLFNLFIILSLSIGFYFSTSTVITEKGFVIPEELINAAVNLSGQQNQVNQLNESSSEPTIPQLSPQLIAQLKQNPQLLAQYGVTPAQLDALSATNQKKTAAGESSPSLVSGLVSAQVERIIEPYKEWIAPLLSLLFFVSLTSLSSFFGLLLPLLIGLLFMILEKTNFIHFEKEMREVKKLVV